MAVEILDTIRVAGRDINFYGDSELITVEGGKTQWDSLVTISVTLKNERYFINPPRFTVKRDTRDDFNFNYDTNIDLVDGANSTFTRSGVTYTYGVNELRLGVDADTTIIEVVIAPEHIGSLLTNYPLGFMDSWVNYVKDGRVTVKINGVSLQDEHIGFGEYIFTSVEVDKNDDNNIQVINNQVGYIFDVEYFNNYYDDKEYSPHTLTGDIIEFNITADNWSQFMKYDSYDYWYVDIPYPSENMFLVRPTEPTEDYPFIKIYDIDEENVESLNGELALINDELLNNNLKPINNYVNSVIRIPYPIESETEPVGVQIANKSFDTTANLISKYVQTIKLGTIEVEHDVLNGIGYKNIDFKLFIPNFKPIELETEQVINRTIDIDLAIDLTTGKGTVNVKIDGTVQYIESENIGKTIPFKADDITINIGNSILETDFIKPYLLITVLEPDNNISSDLIKQRKIDSLLPINYSYIKTEKPLIRSKATRTEQLEIQRLLRNGVYINEH